MRFRPAIILCVLAVPVAFVFAAIRDQAADRTMIRDAFTSDAAYDEGSYVIKTERQSYGYLVPRGAELPFFVRCDDYDVQRILTAEQDKMFMDTCEAATTKVITFAEPDEVDAEKENVENFSLAADQITILDDRGTPFCRTDNGLAKPLMGQPIRDFMPNKAKCAAAMETLIWRR